MRLIQIFGWILLVVLPVIILMMLKTGKLRNSYTLENVKPIACFVLMGIFALGIVSSLLDLFRMWGIPRFVWQFLSLWGFRPVVTAILFPLLRNLPWAVVRFIFPLLNLLFSGGMIFFYATMTGLIKQGSSSFIADKSQVASKNGSPNTFDSSNKIESKFSGGVLPIFLFCIWAPVLLVFSLGLATPFIICTVIRWICYNSSIGGKKYRFKGTAMGLFGRWILWYILTIITFGIYSFWSTRNQLRWVVENIEMIN